METIIQNQGFQHIVEKSLMYLDKKSIISFRLVNNDSKRITESPRVLRVLKVRKLASDITGLWFNVDNFDVHYDSWGHHLSGTQLIARNRKNRLFQYLHKQSLNQVEVDHFELMCKILNLNLIALKDSMETQNSQKLKELQWVDKAYLYQNSCAGILILDQIHDRMHNHIPDETTLANGQKFKLLSLALLGTPFLLEPFNKISRKLAYLMFDSADYVCLKLLLFLNPEVPTLRNPSLVQEINEQVRQTLHEYCSYSRVPDKFNQLLNLLPDLRDMGQCGVDFLYLKHRQSHAPQDSFLKNLLEAAKSN